MARTGGDGGAVDGERLPHVPGANVEGRAPRGDPFVREAGLRPALEEVGRLAEPALELEERDRFARQLLALRRDGHGLARGGDGAVEVSLERADLADGDGPPDVARAARPLFLEEVQEGVGLLRADGEAARLAEPLPLGPAVERLDVEVDAGLEPSLVAGRPGERGPEVGAQGLGKPRAFGLREGDRVERSSPRARRGGPRGRARSRGRAARE